MPARVALDVTHLRQGQRRQLPARRLLRQPGFHPLPQRLTGVAVELQAEGAAFGAALQALWAFTKAQGDPTPISDITARHVTVDPALAARPDPDRSEAYARAYARFLSHLDAITPLQRG